MFQRIRDYRLIETGGIVYRPRAYGDLDPPGGWAAWLVFFPVRGGSAIAPPGPETRQLSLAALQAWAAGVTPVYLEGALERALAVEPPSVVEHLVAAEYEALADAARLDTEAQLERTAADLDEIAAEHARADAEQAREQRLAVERALADREEAAAVAAADRHHAAARRELATAAAARRRGREAQSANEPRARRAARKK